MQNFIKYNINIFFQHQKFVVRSPFGLWYIPYNFPESYGMGLGSYGLSLHGFSSAGSIKECTKITPKYFFTHTARISTCTVLTFQYKLSINIPIQGSLGNLIHWGLVT